LARACVAGARARRRASCSAESVRQKTIPCAFHRDFPLADFRLTSWVAIRSPSDSPTLGGASPSAFFRALRPCGYRVASDFHDRFFRGRRGGVDRAIAKGRVSVSFTLQKAVARFKTERLAPPQGSP
ncbi:hypothetical protein, partial [Burkholderia humptydooensis]|uniref:hypothetical protein n=1 Tax=Burkholderia humptydooensis TaxID=430531 RepID=UPI001E642DA3